MYSKGSVPENITTCGIRYFPKDNPLTEAGFFIKLGLQREKLVASLQNNP